MLLAANRDELQKELNQRGWSQSELARRCSVTRACISQILLGHTPGSRSTWDAIWNALDPERFALVNRELRHGSGRLNIYQPTNWEDIELTPKPVPVPLPQPMPPQPTPDLPVPWRPTSDEG